MASSNIDRHAANVSERVGDLLTELQDALLAFGKGAVVAVVSTDRKPTIEFIRSSPPLRGVPLSNCLFEG